MKEPDTINRTAEGMKQIPQLFYSYIGSKIAFIPNRIGIGIGIEIRGRANDRNPELFPVISISLTADDPYPTNISYIIVRKLLCNMWKISNLLALHPAILLKPGRAFSLKQEKRP